MTSFRFLHAADLHLDSPLRGLDTDATAPAHRIRQASRDALDNLVALALAERVNVLVVAGDLYDGDWSDFRTGHALVAAFAKLTRANIRVVAIRGNHDAESVLTRHLRLPEGATLLDHAAPQTLCFEDLGIAFHGQSFANRAVSENIALGYPAARAGMFNIGLLHTAAGNSETHANYAPCSVAQLAGHGYDYWALGHVHERVELHREPWIVFPGNLQGRHINEPGAKGASLVTVRAGRVESIVHHALDTVRWQRLSVDCTGAPDREAVLDRVRQAMAPALAAAEGRLLALRLSLEGSTPAHTVLARDAGALHGHLQSAAFELSAEDLWIEGLRLRTRLPASPDAAGSGTATGPLAEAIAALAADPGASLAAPVRDYAAKMLALDRGLREALGERHPAVLAADGTLHPALLARARDLLLARLAEDTTPCG